MREYRVVWIYTTSGGTITEIGRNNFSKRRSILEIRDFVEAESGVLECITGVSGWCAEENTKRRFRPRRESF